MKVSVLASGSKGNCTYIETTVTKSLIDIGTTCLYIESSLKDLNIDPYSIQNIFITHTHIDHIAGLKVFIKKYHPTIFLTQKMYNELNKIINITDYILLNEYFVIGDLEIELFKTSHDTSDSVGYIFKSEDKEMVYVTDTGYINQKYHKLLKNKNLYIIESNHDITMLMENERYPYYLKQRIQGDKGHLSNEQAAKYICKDFIGDKTKCIMLAHLSENNNTKEIALETFRNELNKKNHCIEKIIVTDQTTKTELIEV